MYPSRQYLSSVMPGLVPGIHVSSGSVLKTWMAGTSPAMTNYWAITYQSEQ